VSFTDDFDNSEPPQSKQQWIEDVGTYWYYSLILGNFNPREAQKIMDNPADVIAEAFVSMKCYEWAPKRKAHGR